MRQEVAPSRDQRIILGMTLEDLDRAQADLDMVCRNGGVAQITLEAAQTAVVIHKAKIAMALHLFGWHSTDELRVVLGVPRTANSVYVQHFIC